jgi:predicted Na+-dependent transporter
VFLMLLPLALGLFTRSRYPGVADTVQPLAAQTSTVAMGLLTVGLLVVNFDQIVSTVGTGGLAAALLFLVGATAMGLLLGAGPAPSRNVVALGTGQRNLSAAIVIAAQNFAGDPEVITMVMVVGVLGLILLMLTAGELGRRTPEGDRTVTIPEARTTPTQVT